jgi:dienelactone hydrolase
MLPTTVRCLLLHRIVMAVAGALILMASTAADESHPTTVTALWKDFDPRSDPLEAETIREWTSDGAVLRVVRFRIGTFKGQPARMAAFYGFPSGSQQKHPAIMHIHGGGQRADLAEVACLVARGYAVLSVNWGGREMEGAQPGEANTDWGVVDPTQKNVAGYSSMLPGPKQFYDDRESPKNCNWYLLTLGCRRGLTFLEQQPEVDAEKMGVEGFSMGGHLTMYVAGCDTRVKAAVPAAGGSGWRTAPHAFDGGIAQIDHINGDVTWFNQTLGFESYAPLIHCPLLHRGAANDFHGWLDDVYRTNRLITGQPVRFAWSPHFNHRLTPAVAITMPLWFDQYLKGGTALPATPDSAWSLATDDGVPVMTVTPHGAGAWPCTHCDIYYSVGGDPRARFWRSAEVTRNGSSFIGRLPLSSAEVPLFAFANVYFALPSPQVLPYMPDIREFCLSTWLLSATPEQLTQAKVHALAPASAVIDDFRHGWRDWYRLEKDNSTYWQDWTRKITDPEWRGAAGAHLAISLLMPETHRIDFVAIQNEWRNYRGPRKTFLCSKIVNGAASIHTISLGIEDFSNCDDGTPLGSWAQLDEFGMCANFREGTSTMPLVAWKGAVPVFSRLEWIPHPQH